MATPAPAAVSHVAGPALAVQALDVAAGGRTLVRALEFHARGGEFIAILGRNGVGKTLTFHTLAGLRAPSTGVVQLDGRALAAWTGHQRARRLALLPQSVEDPFPSTVFEAALIGRHPHLPFWQWEGPEDLAAAQVALAAVGLGAFAGRSVDSLSGGERRRLDIATLLAQDTAVCLLDEPINHLDLQHCNEVLALFRARAEAGGLVIASLHDATLAERFADRVLLLHGDGRWQFGETSAVLSAENLSALYRVTVEEITFRGRRVFVGG